MYHPAWEYDDVVNLEINDQLFGDYFKYLSSDIIMLYAGYKKSWAGDFYGPAARDHFIYHLVLSGKATLKTQFNFFTIHQGEGFIIFPGELATYKSDAKEPPTYLWIGFKGDLADTLVNKTGMSIEMPVMYHTDVDTAENYMKGLLSFAIRNTLFSSLQGHGLFYDMLSFWAYENEIAKDRHVKTTNSSITDSYIQNAIVFIEQNYYKDINVSDVATYVQIDASYFSRIFKKAYNMTAVEYLYKFRLRSASNLLQHTPLTIADIAESTGFKTSSYFITSFKKQFNCTPNEFRQLAKS